MGCDIDGLIEVKGEDGKWKLHRHIDFDGTRDSPLWCYLFGQNCWKFNPPEYEDKHTGIADNFVSSKDCSPEMKALMEEDDAQLPQYITVKELVDKFKYYEEVPEPYNRKYSGIYDEIFNEMKYELWGKFKDVRLIVWFSC